MVLPSKGSEDNNGSGVPKETKIENVLLSKGRVKILKILADKGELNISEIARRTQLNYSSTRNHLNYLAKTNIVQEKKFGRIRIYRFRIEHLKVRALKTLFDLWENGPAI